MIRSLVIIFATGLAVSVVCLSIAGAMVASDISSGRWKPEENIAAWFPPDVRDEIRREISEEFAADSGYAEFWTGEEVTRDFPWSGAREIDVGMPADVTYSQGPTPKITVTGLAGAVDRFYTDGGDLRLRGWSASNTFSAAQNPNGDGSNSDRPPRLKINVIGPAVERFDLSGSETLVIDGFNQSSMIVEATGASRITARGQAASVNINLAGGARADLSGLTMENLNADLSGESEATAGPSRALTVDGSGDSRFVLTSKPASLIRDLSGDAVIEERAQ